MRKRRTRKYTWFPQLGDQGENPEDDRAMLNVSVPTSPGDGSLSDVNIFSIIPDQPKDTPGTTDQQLEQYIGNEYFLRRIVGKIQFAVSPRSIVDIANSGFTYGFAVGFFVGRADRTASGFVAPVGAATAVERKENYGPHSLQNVREPWIWRRTWVMSQPFFLADGSEAWEGTHYPYHNCLGSVAEGGHIDAKTARRVGNDDRLWIAVQTVLLEGGATPGNMNHRDGFMDIRLLGALRKSHGKSSF